jgi:hypothetical protein
MQKLSLDERKDFARKGARARWSKAAKPGEDASSGEATNQQVTTQQQLPVAMWPGELAIGMACYVLDDGRRIISRTGATDFLTEKRGGGNLESYTRVKAVNKDPNFSAAYSQ